MKKNSSQEILYQVIDAVSSLGIKELLTKIDQIVVKLTSADSTGIYTLDENSNSVVLRASKLHFAIVDKLKMKLGEGITGSVAQYGETIVIEKHAYKDQRFARVSDLPDDLFESFLSVPIKNNNIIVGVINIKHKKSHKYSKKIITLLETIGKLVGQVVQHAALLDKSKNLEEALETQKVVNKAKGILMEKLKLNENYAYHRIRKQAMHEGKSMKVIAEAIITNEKLIQFDKE